MAILNKTLNLLIVPDTSMTTDGGFLGGSLYRIGYKTNLDSAYTIINNVGPIDISTAILSPPQNAAILPNTSGHNLTMTIALNYTTGAAPKPTTLSIYSQPMCEPEASTAQRHAYTVVSLSGITWP
jgi:hypothetical protein